jgi:hypothetical protein
MIGQIESYNEEKQIWIIKSEEQLFDFVPEEWSEDEGPYPGDNVLFEAMNGKATVITLIGKYPDRREGVKSRRIAALLGFFLGGLGVHRFYLGYYRIGIIQIVVTAITMGFGLLWGFVEGFLIIVGRIHEDAQGRPLK